jgi:anti-sigma factor RsiW
MNDEHAPGCERCAETVRRLKEENGYLRRAAADFGELAERLNRALLDERRKSAARREPQEDRPTLGSKTPAVSPPPWCGPLLPRLGRLRRPMTR